MTSEDRKRFDGTEPARIEIPEEGTLAATVTFRNRMFSENCTFVVELELPDGRRVRGEDGLSLCGAIQDFGRKCGRHLSRMLLALPSNAYTRHEEKTRWERYEQRQERERLNGTGSLKHLNRKDTKIKGA